MGKLVERKIPTLFGGVSRQPDHVRRPNQVTAMDNALASVVTGGFEKRPCTQLIAALTADVTAEHAVHFIDRDSTEQLLVLTSPGVIQVYNSITGTAKTVTIGDTKRYFLIEESGLDSTGIVQADGDDFVTQLKFDSGETTFAWGWKLSDATTGRFKVEGSVDGTTWNDIATGKGGAASGTFNTTIDAVATGDHNYIRFNITTGMATAADTMTIWATFKDKTYLFTGITGPEDFAFVSVADHTFVVNKMVTTRLAEADSGTVTDTARSTAAGTPPAGLPAPSGNGNIYRIINDQDRFATYYVIDDATEDLYVETADPNGYNQFDQSTMPHELVRNADGTFTFAATTWDPRAAGDAIITEAPSFIGKKIADAVFFRNRLGLLADEGLVLTRSADAYDWWPEKAIEVLDTDPIDRSATTTDVNLLKFATVFRKLLFATSDRAQFELVGSDTNGLTPDTATFDQATRYPASPLARPVSMGDVLYFASSHPAFSAIYEYFFDQSSLNNSAAEITKHVQDYVPRDIFSMAVDTGSNSLFVLTTGEQNAVYVYRSFFDGGEKLQSSWGRYLFGATEADAFVHGMGVLSGFLVLVIERADGMIYLEQMTVDPEAFDTTLGFIPLLDQREILTGTHDATNDVTTFTPTWKHTDDAEIVLGPAFADPGRRVTVLYPDEYLLTLASVLAGETIIINSVTFIAHASTTTAANREFNIAGTDAQDATELVSLINDATYGVTGVTATDNSDGTISLDTDDAADGTITAPTGTAIVNATITAAEVNQKLAVRGNFDTNQVYAGRPYEKVIELSHLFVRESEDKPAIISGRLQVRDISFRYETTGYFKVVVTPQARTAQESEFSGNIVGSSDTQVGSPPISDSGVFTVPVRSDGSTAKIEVKNDSPFPSIIVGASWRGFFNELSRQG